MIKEGLYFEDESKYVVLTHRQKSEIQKFAVVSIDNEPKVKSWSATHIPYSRELISELHADTVESNLK